MVTVSALGWKRAVVRDLDPSNEGSSESRESLDGVHGFHEKVTRREGERLFLISPNFLLKILIVAPVTNT